MAKRMLVVFEGYHYSNGKHPLAGGDAPVWADGWGESQAGPFVEVGTENSLRFIFYPGHYLRDPSLWFCEVEGSLDEELTRRLAEVHAVDASEVVAAQIREYEGYKCRVRELLQAAAWRKTTEDEHLRAAGTEESPEISQIPDNPVDSG